MIGYKEFLGDTFVWRNLLMLNLIFNMLQKYALPYFINYKSKIICQHQFQNLSLFVIMTTICRLLII